jgi:DNA-directed RNA polymerase specialized sigma subunit
MSGLKKCSAECLKNNSACQNNECKFWIDYKKELNCSVISIYIHGKMTLKQIADRLGISIARVKQIETKALNKLKNTDFSFY